MNNQNRTDIWNTEVWNNLINDLKISANEVAKYLNTNEGIDINNEVHSVGIRYWDRNIQILLNDNGLGIQKVINALIDVFFPNVENFKEAFEIILKNFFILSKDSNINNFENNLILNLQKKVIKEFVLFIISPISQTILTNIEENVLLKLIEAYRTSLNLSISQNTLSNLFRSNLINTDKIIRKLLRFLHIEEISKDINSPATGKIESMKFFQFSKELIEILNEYKIIKITKRNGQEIYEILNENFFNEDLFFAIILAHISSVERNNLNKFQKWGIISNFMLLFLLVTQENVTKYYGNEGNFIYQMEQQGYNKEYMNIIPKSWMIDSVVDIYLIPLAKCIAYIIGGLEWLATVNVKKTEEKEYKSLKKIFKQMLTRFPTINQWKLGQKIRVQIPILVHVGNIFAEIETSVSNDKEN